MKKWLARKILQLWGWRIEGEAPEPRRFVMIAAPHTSNWDFPLMLLFASAFEIKIRWLGKNSLFNPPFGWFMRLLGGIAVVRHENQNVVSAMASTFEGKDSLVVVVPTEGTRAYADYWKSGFYHIAEQAGVAIVPSYLDYSQKRGGFGPPILPQGDVRADMAKLREFYAPMGGKFPEQSGPVRLKEEESAEKEPRKDMQQD